MYNLKINDSTLIRKVIKRKKLKNGYLVLMSCIKNDDTTVFNYEILIYTNDDLTEICRASTILEALINFNCLIKEYE